MSPSPHSHLSRELAARSVAPGSSRLVFSRAGWSSPTRVRTEREAGTSDRAPRISTPCQNSSAHASRVSAPTEAPRPRQPDPHLQTAPVSAITPGCWDVCRPQLAPARLAQLMSTRPPRRPAAAPPPLPSLLSGRQTQPKGQRDRSPRSAPCHTDPA